MRKGNAPFVFSACVVACMPLISCGGDDSSVPPAGGGAGDSSGAGGIAAGTDGGTGGFDGGRGGRGGQGFGDGGGGITFTFDAQILRDPNCPPAMPMDNDPCTVAATCAYPTAGCTCQREGHGSDAGRSWHCQEFPPRDGGYMMCSDGTASGTACEMQGRFCTTGSQTCGCFGNPGAGKWNCF